jgi:thiamine biosynthesis lipoprotein
MAAELRFQAMGSDAHVIVNGPGSLAERARRRIDDLERRWSRFLDDSEVSRLTQQAGRPVAVSPETVELVRRAVEAWRLTGGAFDPTVLGAVLRAGYDRSFELLSHAGGPSDYVFVYSDLMVGCSDIEIDAAEVTLPAGTGFDPGGIGKGLAADIVCRELRAEGAEGICVNLGGDVRVAGVSPAGGSWTVAVEHPWFPWPLAHVGLEDGAVATSTTLLRRWTTPDGRNHHLIDPGTGEPSDTDLTLATVVAAEAWLAEVLAKAVLLRGARRAFDLVDGTGAEALVVGRGARVMATQGFDRFTRRPPVEAA